MDSWTVDAFVASPAAEAMPKLLCLALRARMSPRMDIALQVVPHGCGCRVACMEVASHGCRLACETATLHAWILTSFMDMDASRQVQAFVTAAPAPCT